MTCACYVGMGDPSQYSGLWKLTLQVQGCVTDSESIQAYGSLCYKFSVVVQIQNGLQIIDVFECAEAE